MKRSYLLAVFFLVVLSLSAYAQDLDYERSVTTPWYDELKISLWVGIYLVLLTLFIFSIGQKLACTYKKTFFVLIVAPVILTTLYIAGGTIYHNIHSVTGGPVHWHADYQVWSCDERLDLVDPKGLRNKIGTPLFHEHNDDRIHVEGTVAELRDVSLGVYFKVIGGDLTDTSIAYPTINGMVEHTNGDACPSGEGTLKVYVNGQRIENAPEYVLSPYELVPPGDCIIFEFGPGDADTTDRLCLSWEVADKSYEVQNG